MYVITDGDPLGSPRAPGGLHPEPAAAASTALPASPPPLRQRRDGILPTTAAALSLPAGGALTATAARSGAEPEPHPLVRAVLDRLGPDERERHDGRCPEAILLSRRLTAAGAATQGKARRALKHARITTRHIREEGDPLHGAYASHCRSCAALLAHFGVRSVSPDAGEPPPGRRPARRGGARRAEPAPAVSPDEAAARALAAAGWHPGRRLTGQAGRWRAALRGHLSPLGHPLVVCPAAEQAWAEYGGLRLTPPPGPGREHAPSPVVIDPLRALHAARALIDLGRALGTELSPLGEAAGAGGARLAIDREGRVYAIDHTGDWYLGPDLPSALAVLLAGTAPHRLTAAPPV